MYTFLCGFVAGVTFVVACGGSSATMAAVLGDAIDVLYDTTESALASGTVQGALDELDAAVDALEGDTAGTLLQGEWTGQVIQSDGNFDATLTIGSDNSFECTGDNQNDEETNNDTKLRNNDNLCSFPLTWALIGKKSAILSDGARQPKRAESVCAL